MKTAAPRADHKLAQLFGLARIQGGVFSRAQAQQLGYSWRRLETLAKRGTITSFLNQWIAPSLAKVDHTAVAHAITLRFGPKCVVSGAAAAQILGADGDWPQRFAIDKPMVYLSDPSHIRIEDARIIRRTFDGIVLTRGRLRLADRTTALLDCVDSVLAANREGLIDYLLQRRWLKREAVEERVAARRASRLGRRSTSAQIHAQRHAAEGTESAAERLMRRVLLAAGLRQGGRLGWQPNHLVRVPDRGGNHLRLARIDFAWPDCRLAVEVDGRAFHSTDAAFESDRDRRNDLESVGWMVLNVTWKGIKDSPGSVIRRVSAGLRRQRSLL